MKYEEEQVRFLDWKLIELKKVAQILTNKFDSSSDENLDIYQLLLFYYFQQISTYYYSKQRIEAQAVLENLKIKMPFLNVAINEVIDSAILCGKKELVDHNHLFFIKNGISKLRDMYKHFGEKTLHNKSIDVIFSTLTSSYYYLLYIDYDSNSNKDLLELPQPESDYFSYELKKIKANCFEKYLIVMQEDDIQHLDDKNKFLELISEYEDIITKKQCDNYEKFLKKLLTFKSYIYKKNSQFFSITLSDMYAQLDEAISVILSKSDVLNVSYNFTGNIQSIN